ncbi:hypothetical protein [Solitalea lacus]|uniref:hypothetical protein n=1 Tax=Solitalea lacus TaxID=2911172 RepID=UPI001EDA10FA|nr:hypothetical protein [Solitalea lacus]UKJ07588.1 hypothetical protein L2B55_00140 [Solitalea lacus]
MDLNLNAQTSKLESIPTVSKLSKVSSVYEATDGKNIDNQTVKLYRKEVILPVLLMLATLIIGNNTGISAPELTMIGIGCVWYIVSCYKVFREDEKN